MIQNLRSAPYMRVLTAKVILAVTFKQKGGKLYHMTDPVWNLNAKKRLRDLIYRWGRG
jgi:hypothetical protein